MRARNSTIPGQGLIYAFDYIEQNISSKPFWIEVAEPPKVYSSLIDKDIWRTFFNENGWEITYDWHD